MAENGIQILDDQPIDNATFFNFDAYAEALAGIITREKTNTPLVVGIFGDWGSGKTSLMKTLEQNIKKAKDGYPAQTVWFNAWKYDKEEAIWRALITRVLEELKIGFTWDEIPKKDSDRFKKYLREKYGAEWVLNAAIELENNEKIKISNANNSAFLELSKEKNDAILKINGKSEEFILTQENEVLKIFVKYLYKDLNDLQTSLYKEIYREYPGALTFDLGKAAKSTLMLGLSMAPIVGPIFEKLTGRVGIDTKDSKKSHESGEAKDFKETTDAIMTLSEAVYRKKIISTIEKVQFIEQFHKKFEDIIKEYYLDKKKRAVIFIDDLDRCVPEKAIEVLEAIKLFLDVEGCIFILGIDSRVVSQGINFKYRDYLVGGGEFPSKVRSILKRSSSLASCSHLLNVPS